MPGQHQVQPIASRERAMLLRGVLTGSSGLVAGVCAAAAPLSVGAGHSPALVLLPTLAAVFWFLAIFLGNGIPVTAHRTRAIYQQLLTTVPLVLLLLPGMALIPTVQQALMAAASSLPFLNVPPDPSGFDRWRTLIAWVLAWGLPMTLPLILGRRTKGALAPHIQQTQEQTYPAEVSRVRGTTANPGGWEALSDSVGLALSGGGVRSACFSLGGMQALDDTGVLRHVDLVSSVSGGGYTAFAWLTRHEGGDTPFPFGRHANGIKLTQSMSERVNYLNPEGLAGVARIVSAVFRGPVAQALMGPFPAVLIAGWMAWAMHHYAAVSTLIRWLPALFIGTGSVLFLVGLVLGALFRRMLARHDAGGVVPLSVGMGALLLIGIGLLPSAVDLVGTTSVRVGSLTGGAAGLGAAVLGLAVRLWTLVQRGDLRRVPRPVVIGLAVLVTILLPYLSTVAVAATLVHFHRSSFLFNPGWAYLVSAVLCLVLNLFYDVNANALSSHYRESLARAFLPGSSRSPTSGGPLHIVNTTLNVELPLEPGADTRMDDNQTDDEKTAAKKRPPAGPVRKRKLRGRSFTFTQDWVGSRETGYAPRRAYDAWAKLDAADLMGISGAVISPTMGRYSLGPLRFLMTLLNLRMGQWVPNPALLPADEGPKAPPAPFPALRFLLQEATSTMGPEDPWVYLTDGGHEENLGVLELLRRRCRLVIVFDAEHDSGFRFEGLFRLIELARRETDSTILLSVDGLRPGPDGRSLRHAAIGDIIYGGPDRHNRSIGTLLYVKASRTAGEHPMVSSFAQNHPEFPHDSTANQFFTSAHFEAYRNLAYRAVKELFEACNGQGTPLDRDRLFNWVTRGDGLRYQLDADDLGKGPDRRQVLARISTLNGRRADRATARARLRLMEEAEASLDLRLPANRAISRNQAVLATFRQWCEDAEIAAAIVEEGHTFSSHLRRFVEQLDGPVRTIALERGSDGTMSAIITVARGAIGDPPRRRLCSLRLEGSRIRFDPPVRDESISYMLAKKIAQEVAFSGVDLLTLELPGDRRRLDRWLLRLRAARGT